MHTPSRLFLVGSLALACGPQGGIAPGAATHLRTTCETAAVLSFVNDANTTTADLREAGVYSRGATNIVTAREQGTTFDSIEALDAVRYIGASSLDALYTNVGTDACQDVPLPCDESAVLALVNNADTTAAELRALGVYSRGANRIVSLRDDGTSFEDLGDLDAVPYIGASSLDALMAWGAGQCSTDSTADVVFSPQWYDESHLAQTKARLATAQHSVDLAMYSFSDGGMYDAVQDLLDRGVSVRVIFQTANDDRKDPEGSRSERLEAMGAEVRWVNKIMHHKFVIIDGPRTGTDALAQSTLITGSGNWSYGAATKYDENTIFVQNDDKLILSFQQEFNLMWQNSRVFVSNESIPHVPVTFEITDEMVDNAEGTEVVFTSSNFRVYESSRYGMTFAARTGEHRVADRLVALIENATSSIEIASGHMRSPQIANALIAKHQSDPAVEIRVYLDGQEWISEWKQDDQARDLAECLADATTDTQTDRCYEVGHYYSKALADAGIDVRFDYYAYRWHYKYAEQMHHKYVIIDNSRVFSGSYNFSSNAEVDSFENAVILDAARYPAVVDSFLDNFESLWITGQSDDLYSQVMDEFQLGTSSTIDIVWSPMSLSWSQVDALKDAVKAACPDVNADEYRAEPWNHQTCNRAE